MDTTQKWTPILKVDIHVLVCHKWYISHKWTPLISAGTPPISRHFPLIKRSGHLRTQEKFRNIMSQRQVFSTLIFFSKLMFSNYNQSVLWLPSPCVSSRVGNQLFPSASAQDLNPNSYNSFITVRLHVSFGLPLFLLPFCAQVRVVPGISSFSIRNTWPIHHLRLFFTWVLMNCQI